MNKPHGLTGKASNNYQGLTATLHIKVTPGQKNKLVSDCQERGERYSDAVRNVLKENGLI